MLVYLEHNEDRCDGPVEGANQSLKGTGMERDLGADRSVSEAPATPMSSGHREDKLSSTCHVRGREL